MDFIQDDKTKKFVAQVKNLVNEGVEPTYKTVAEKIGWHSNSLSVTMKGGRNVPYEVYKKFLEIYKQEEPDGNQDWRDNKISFLQEQNQYLKEQVSELKERIDSRTLQLHNQIEKLSRSLAVHDQTAKLSLAYCKTLYLRMQEHFARVEGAHPKEVDEKVLEAVADDMDRLLAQQLEEVFQQGGERHS
jgi:gas vesicle protein